MKLHFIVLFAALSPGLAALTVGCDSGNLGAMSRVQLLLLDRVEAGTPPSPLSLEEELPAGQDWSHLRLQHLESAGKSGSRKHVSSSTIRQRPQMSFRCAENCIISSPFSASYSNGCLVVPRVGS